MLIKGEDEGVCSLNEGKSSEQVKLFSTEVCGDFRQHLVTVVEFGSRLVKKARLLSDTDDPVKEAQVSSLDRRSLAQCDFLEESNGNVGRMSQVHQGEGLISEISSIITNGLRSRNAGMKMASPIYENVQNGVNIRTVSEQKSGALEDEKIGLLNHGKVNGNSGCTVHLMQEDADDTTSTSGDEGLFVIQVRSPASKQLLHSRKQSNDQQSDGSPRRRSNTQYTKKLGAKKHHDKGAIDDTNELNFGLSRNVSKETGTLDMEGQARNASEASTLIGIEKNTQPTSTLRDEVEAARAVELVPEQIERTIPQVIQEVSAVGVSDTVCEGEAGVNSSEILNVYVRKRKWSSPAPIATVDSVRSQECGSSQSEDRVGGRIIKHYVRRPHRQTDSHSQAPMIEKPSEHVMTSSSDGGKGVVNSPQVEHHTDTSVRVESEGKCNVFQRRSKMNHLSHAGHRADVSMPIADIARVESEKDLIFFQRRSIMHQSPGAEHYARLPARVESEDNLSGFQRRSKMSHLSRAEHHADNSTPKADVSRVKSEGTLNVFQRRSKKNQLPGAEHHTDASVRVESEENFNVFQRRSKMNQAEQHAGVSAPKADAARVESEGTLHVFHRRSKKNQLPEAENHAVVPARVESECNLNVFQRRSKKKLPQKKPSRSKIISLQNEVNEKHIPPGYVRADHQPNWLPEGWSLEIREGKSIAHPRDKYYHDHKSGRIFRSKNEVLQFLVDGRVVGAQMLSDRNGMKVQLQNKKRPPVPIPSAKQAGFQSPSLNTQTGVIFQTAPSRTLTGMGEQCQGDMLGKDAGATTFHGCAEKNSQLLSSGDGVQFPTGSVVSLVEPPTDQGDKENRGKLIFRLKRKQPDSEGGKGRSKRPMYEVVHGEKASSSTSIPTNQEKLTTGERTGQDVPPIPGLVQMHLHRISSVKETLSPNVASGSMSLKAQVEKHILLEKPPFNSPSPLIMPPVDRTPDQSVASSYKVTSFERSRGTPDSILLQHSTMSNWGIKHNPLQYPSQHLELLQQEPYTALGIPATARYSGLQQMASYSTNHTHVFLDPVDNTLPLSWQYPFTSQTSTLVTASVPTCRPFSSAFTSSVAKTIFSTVPIPVFEHYPGVTSSKNLNASATMFPCSESGVDSRTRDSNVKLAEGGPQVQKAFKAPKQLSKADHTKLFLDLGRRLCLAGVEQRNSQSVGTLNPLLESQTLVTNLEEKSLQQGVVQATPSML